MPERLYCLADIAALYGVGASAVSNWRRRGSGPQLPEAAFEVRGKPLWTREQLAPILADRIAEMQSVLEEN